MYIRHEPPEEYSCRAGCCKFLAKSRLPIKVIESLYKLQRLGMAELSLFMLLSVRI
jgi:hypothetical protein